MLMIDRVLILTLLSCTVPLVAYGEEGDSKPLPDSILGTWGVTKSEASGKPVELAWTWMFKPDSKANLHDRKEGKQSVFKYTLDRSTEPQRITIEYLGPEQKLRGSKQLGILKRSKEGMLLHLNPPGVDTYPNEFKTAAGKGFLMELEYMPTE